MLIDQEDISELHRTYFSKHGHTLALDFGIGNTSFLGKGLAAPTLKAFVEFLHRHGDPLADTFFIDPDENNTRARYIYEKAGFHEVGHYMHTLGAWGGQQSLLMIKNLAIL